MEDGGVDGASLLAGKLFVCVCMCVYICKSMYTNSCPSIDIEQSKAQTLTPFMNHMHHSSLHSFLHTHTTHTHTHTHKDRTQTNNAYA